ncbi:MAG: hypothetical protein NZT61_05825 [Deltaproteobacteria bacterium]|nr:hypothetical protein [Deltaproteobacteria bacterium]
MLEKRIEIGRDKIKPIEKKNLKGARILSVEEFPLWRACINIGLPSLSKQLHVITLPLPNTQIQLGFDYYFCVRVSGSPIKRPLSEFEFMIICEFLKELLLNLIERYHIGLIKTESFSREDKHPSHAEYEAIETLVKVVNKFSGESPQDKVSNFVGEIKELWIQKQNNDYLKGQDGQL